MTSEEYLLEFQKHRLKLCNFLRRFIPNETEDVLQDLYISTMKKPELISLKDNIYPWLKKCAKNIAISFLRKKKEEIKDLTIFTNKEKTSIDLTDIIKALPLEEKQIIEEFFENNKGIKAKKLKKFKEIIIKEYPFILKQGKLKCNKCNQEKSLLEFRKNRRRCNDCYKTAVKKTHPDSEKIVEFIKNNKVSLIKLQKILKANGIDVTVYYIRTIKKQNVL